MHGAPTAVPVPDRDTRVEQALAGPVVLAALASVPAMFLTMAEGRPATVGTAINWLSLGVLTAESVVLFALAGNRLAWARRNWWLLGVTVAAVPAVIFAAGGLQVLRLVRLVRFVGAVRIVRVRRIVKASRILQRRVGHSTVGRWAAWTTTGAAGIFVAIVLSDPTSTSRQVVDGGFRRFGPGLVGAAAIVAVATVVVARQRQRDRAASREPDPPGPEI